MYIFSFKTLYPYAGTPCIWLGTFTPEGFPSICHVVSVSMSLHILDILVIAFSLEYLNCLSYLYHIITSQKFTPRLQLVYETSSRYIVFVTWHHELLREAMRGDFLGGVSWGWSNHRVASPSGAASRLFQPTSWWFSLCPSLMGSSRPSVTLSSRNSGCHSGRVTYRVSDCSWCERFSPTRMETEGVRNLPRWEAQKAATSGWSWSE